MAEDAVATATNGIVASPAEDKATRAKTLSLVLTRLRASSDERESFKNQWDRWRKLYVAESVIPTSREGLNNIFDPVLFEICETQRPRFMQAIFGTKPLFPLEPQGDEDVQASKNMEKFLQWQIDSAMISPDTSPFVAIDKAFMQFVHYGSIVMQMSWDAENERPYLECGDIYEYFPDPMVIKGGAARYWVRRRVITREDVERLVEKGVYNADTLELLGKGGTESNAKGTSEDSDTNPAREIDNLPSDDSEFRSMVSGSMKEQARHDQPIELHEYWEADRLVHVLDRRIVAMDRDNPHDLKEIPIWLVAAYPLPDRLYGLGNAELGETMQYEINSKGNQALDQVDLLLNAPIKVRRGANINEAECKFRPGKFWWMDDLSDVDALSLPNYAIGTLQDRRDLKDSLARRLGTSDYTSGQSGQDRVGVVIRLLIEQANMRFGMMAQRFFEVAIRNWYRWSVSLNLQFLSPEAWTKTMGDQPNPFQDELGGKAEFSDLIRNMVMPATYYTGSKALKAQQFGQTVEAIGKNPAFLSVVNVPMLVRELLVANDVEAPERFLMTGQEDEANATEENQKLMMGVRIAPERTDNHDLHIQLHMVLAQGLSQVEAGAPPALMQEAKVAIMSHLSAHKLMLDQMMSAQAEAQQGTGSRTPRGIVAQQGPASTMKDTRESEPMMDNERQVQEVQ